MSRQLSKMSRYVGKISWLTLSALLISFSLFGFSLSTHAAEAPGALTVIVKDQITDRPLPSVQITITKRGTHATQSVETDAQGRVVIEQLDPGLYSVGLAKGGFAATYEDRKSTRLNYSHVNISYSVFC